MLKQFSGNCILSSKKVTIMTEVNRSKIIHLLNKLLEKNLIVRVSSGCGTKYRLA